jgi:hypothetical protein
VTLDNFVSWLWLADRHPFVGRPAAGFEQAGIPHRLENFNAGLEPLVHAAHVDGHAGDLSDGLNEVDILQLEIPGLAGVNPQGAHHIAAGGNRNRQDRGDALLAGGFGILDAGVVADVRDGYRALLQRLGDGAHGADRALVEVVVAQPEGPGHLQFVGFSIDQKQRAALGVKCALKGLGKK